MAARYHASRPGQRPTSPSHLRSSKQTCPQDRKMLLHHARSDGCVSARRRILQREPRARARARARIRIRISSFYHRRAAVRGSQA